MQRNNQSTEINESSTSKICTSLRLGGPPLKKPVLGHSVQIYDGSEEIKIDEDGRSYIGMSIKELLQKEKNEGKDILSHPLQSENGIYDLDQKNVAGITEQQIKLSLLKSDQSAETSDFSEEDDDLQQLTELANQRKSSRFYDKNRDLYCWVKYKKNENPLDTGCELHWIESGSYREDDPPSHPYDDKAYIFIESKNQLLYGNRSQFEEIKINDLAKFKKIFKDIMNNEYQYDYKHLTYEEINRLVTLNTGHVPSREKFPNPISIEINEANSNSRQEKKDK